MSYQVLARKWRPRNFSEMEGQEHVLRALINALDRDQLHHAYLFTGTRGVGKTPIARIFAKSLNCETNGVTATPCGTCAACQEIDEGRFVDLIEVDAASRTKVEETRDLLDNVQYMPTKGRYKVYLIDEVHMFSNHSVNALLKTLEEPPPHVKFLLATTDPQKLPVTIRSRCLQFNLKRISSERIADYLGRLLQQEAVACETEGLKLIARAAEGSMRDALSLLDQAIAYGGGHVDEADVAAMLGTIEQRQLLNIVEALIQQDGVAMLQQVELLAQQAVDFGGVLIELIGLLHQMALLQSVPEVAADRGVNGEWVNLANQLSAEDLQLFYQIALMGRKDLPLAVDPRSGLEMVLLRMLAFQPLNQGGVAVTSPPSSPTPPARIHRRSSTARHSAEAKVTQAVPLQIHEPPPATEAVTGRASPNVTSVHSDSPVLIKSGQPLSAEHWEQTIPDLGLRGLAGQLIQNSIFIEHIADRVLLEIPKKSEAIRNEKSQQRVEEALGQFLGAPIKLSIQVSQETVLDTPAHRAEQRVEQARAEAVEVIQQDADFQSLLKTFEGSVVDGSIEPVPPS